ncbi:MAG: CHASE2 domain-containing protein [Gammaproteobacteria bacterium]
MPTRLLIRFVITIAVFVPFYLHVSDFSRIGFLDDLEASAYDARLHLTLPRTIDDSIVIVDIDERSMRLEGQWPWPRRKVAALVDSLFDHYDARVVGFDVLFPEADGSSGLETLNALVDGPLADVPEFRERVDQLRPSLNFDQIFAESLHDRKTVMGYVFRQDAEFQAVNALPAPLLTEEEHQTHLAYSEPDSYTGSLDVLMSNAAAGGFIDNPLVDRDGMFRRVPVLQNYRGDLYESLALAVTRLALDSPPLEFVFHSQQNSKRDGLDIEWLTLGDYRIPIDDEAAVLVPYRGGQYHFPYVSATDVLRRDEPRFSLAGKIVLVGTSAAGLRDMRVTPVGGTYNGVEVQANIVSGILDQRIKQHPRYVQGAELVTLILVGLIATIMLMSLPVVTATLGTLLMAVILVAVNLQIWSHSNFVMPIATTLGFLFMLYLFHMIVGYVTETRGRRLLSRQFGQYVPPELVNEMGQRHGNFSMESESRVLTVMFSDVRDFTTIAETMAPRELSQLMNEFLTPMTRVIHAHRGTIDKYMGDSVMAFWGAPIADTDHARHALEAALAMRDAVEALGAEFERRGWPPLRVGFGLNTGEMRVGDMGSRFRRAYTVLGDAVNLASRIEGLTKTYGVSIAVGENMRALLDEEFAFLELDRVRVKGKDQAVAIYEPIARKDQLDAKTSQMLMWHKTALRAYRQGNWDSAEANFFKLNQSFPDRDVFAIYLDRIAHFRSAPPRDEWDGVFSYAVK